MMEQPVPDAVETPISRPVSLLEELTSLTPESRHQAALALKARVDDAPHPERDPLDRTRDVLDAEWETLGPEGTRLVEPLVTLLIDYPHSPIGDVAAWALATQGEDGLTALVALLRHPYFPIRFLAAGGLAVAGARARWLARRSILSSLVLDDRWLANTNLVRALGRIGGEESLRLLSSIQKCIHRIWDGVPARQQEMWPAVMAALSEARLQEVLEGGRGKPDGKGLRTED